MKTNDQERAKVGAKLAEEHDTAVLASALMVRLTNDGHRELAGAVLGLLAGKLGVEASGLFPDPPSPG